ncbi:hypothetical protein CFP56_002353 [Quercus suber]|uniref:PGG domain-containing protein n=1 Tax=Quercus suber TaxID=58331 RepID=A0AAW0IKL9_QUESU
MVVATVITTLPFQQTTSPPGSVWSQSGNVTFYTVHNIKIDAGTSVIGSIDLFDYFYFIIFNAISFIASVIVNFLMISGILVKNKICMGLLKIALYTTLAFLVITYIIAIYMVTPFSLLELKYKEVFSIQIWVLGSLVVLVDAGGSVERVNNPSESAKTTQARKKWWKNLSKHLKYRGNWVEENRGYIMVVATVIITLTFQQATSPPGGVWSQSGNVTFYTSHNIKIDVGTSVIGSIDLLDYFYFIIFNVISFIASVIVSFLLISGFLVKNKISVGLRQ